MSEKTDAVVLISAGAEWRAVRPRLSTEAPQSTPFGEMFRLHWRIDDRERSAVVMHGGWGKIAAAASTQYAIDQFQPRLVVNLGTCGGFRGDVVAGTVILADFTMVYDIFEQMGDADEALAHYATEIDLSWVPAPPPSPTWRTMLVSADRDIVSAEVDKLRATYGAVAADWESGAIAYVCRRNNVRCLILRAVSDLVGPESDELYGQPELFEERAAALMDELFGALPGWLAAGLAA